jgi:hypothetical protein
VISHCDEDLRRALLAPVAPRPYVIEDPEQVEERRCAVGPEPLSERLTREKPEPLPRDRERFEGEYQSWLLRVGWRS